MNTPATTATVTPFTQNLKQQQQKQQTAKEVIAANVQALVEQLEQGYSEGLTAYLLAMGKFHNYSFGNIMEIARQKPDATRVAGMYAWNQLGSRVKKGEKGIRILAPMIGIRRKKDAEAEKDIRTQNQPVLVGFRSAYVFDVSQTEGAELPELSERVKGNVGEYRERLIDFVIAQGIELDWKESISPALGVSYGGKIVLFPGQETAEEFSTLVHELAHEMLHKAERRTATTNHVFERSAVQDERAILQAAIDRSMGQASYTQVRQEFEQRVSRGEFRVIERTDGRAAPLYTTAEMIRMEREIVGHMQRGNQRGYDDPMLVSPQLRIWTEDSHPELNRSQRQAVDKIFLSREKIVGLDGVAGAGKTTALSVVREGAEAQGYKVEGFAPTSRAAHKLAEAGMETSILQRHLAKGTQPETGEKRLYVLDESSLASTRQMHEFIERLHRNDRVLLVGDSRQYEAVEAGRPFAQLQEAGMRTATLNDIVRQRDPELKQVVEQLANGQVGAAIESLDQQGRLHLVKGNGERIAAIAREYASGTLVVSPDNRSRSAINLRIHDELQSRGLVNRQDHSVRTLVPRQEMTGADRGWAQQYQVDDILRYSRTSKETGIEKGEYSRVLAVNSQANTLTVGRGNGEQTTYDPRRQVGVSVYREDEKRFSVGDRIQFTAPSQELKIANRDLGTVASIGRDGTMRLRLDDERKVEFNPQQHPHVDHGYAVTSYSSQGQTAERVLVNVDTELAAKDLLNSRMAYVSISRGQFDAQIFTDNREKLPQALGHDVSHKSAYKPERAIGLA